MKFNLVLILIATICLGGCGVDEIKEDKKEVKLPELELSANQNGTVDERFFSKDRKVEQILEDFEKPLMSYPKIWQEEAVIKKNGRLYRKGLLDEPFTGTVVESFPDGSISLETSYYRGLPHGQQNRKFPSGNPALQANFDQGVLVGVKSRWWPSGFLREEAYWSEGKYIGRRLWDRTGRLIKEEVIPQS